jgi:HNH endonuclease
MKKHKFDIEDERDAIWLAIQRVASCLGKTPTQKEYKSERNEDEPSLEQITYRLGTWSSAVHSAGLEPNPFQQPPRQLEITKQQLVDEFIRVANELDRIPSMQQFRANACYSWTPYKTNWGSWKQAVDSIKETHSHRLCFDAKPSRQKKSTRRRKYLGISCALLFEPQNEYETIALFCLLAEELGFKIKRIHSAFPDALLEQEGVDIPTEFEFLSSNYQQHCHPLDFDGIVICWRKDVDLDGIRTISLEEYVRKKKA